MIGRSREEKKAVVTITIGRDYKKISFFTHPTIKKYAQKIGADFISIAKKKISETTPHWEKFQIAKLLDKYDRIIYLDTDVIIRDDCPDIFREIPEEKLGAFNEARFTARSRELMIDVCQKYNVRLSDWDGKYYNTGVMVISRRHKNLFIKPEKEIFSFYEQSYLNMMIAKERVPVEDLHYNFNRMTCMDPFVGEVRHGSYIIHYAGYPSLAFVLDLIPKDLEKWKKDKSRYNYKKHIYITVNGGLGDQICAEPAIRFLKKNLFSGDEVIIGTHWPRLFRHFKKLGIEISEHGKARQKPDTPYLKLTTLPGPETLQWAVVSHLLCHTVDYASISLMKRTLPVYEKRIRFELTKDDEKNLSEHIKKEDLKNLVVIHAGRHWDSKTFPKKWWQEVIDGIAKNGKKVCLIGKDELGDPPDFKAGARGTVDVKCPNGSYDLRNLLDLGSLAFLLSKAKVLVSNDSSPVHLAGAFDNWIVLIPSCKHPDHILPFRGESQFYKTKSLYKKLIVDEIEARPTQVYPTSADVKVKNWDKYLPKPADVVKEVLNILNNNAEKSD